MPKPETGFKMRLFYSYSHQDESLRNELEKHIVPLKREGLIESWHDREIGAGTNWDEELNKNFEAADVILLLVSADFLASEYCYEKEMKRAMEKHQAVEAIVIPIILREADWKSSPFSQLQALPKDLKPVTSWANRDEAWANVVTGLRKAIEKLRVEIEREICIIEDIKPDEFQGKIISVNDMKEEAKTLYRLAVQSRFIPDIIIGLNGGGLVVAAAMNASFVKPIGAIDFRNSGVTYVSLPHIEHHKEIVEPQHKKILVTDTKLKSGGALQRTKNILYEEYGEDSVIRYGVVLSYGGWDLSRWKVIRRDGFHWPIQFRPKKCPVYVARYTNTSPNNDRIIEELHPGWEKV